MAGWKFSNSWAYYQTYSIITEGPYQGYSLLGETSCFGTQDCGTILLATKDYQSFVLDNSITTQHELNYFAVNNIYLNASKIVGQGYLAGSIPPALNFAPPYEMVYPGQNYPATLSSCFASSTYNPEYGIASLNASIAKELVPGATLSDASGAYTYSMMDGPGNSDFHCDTASSTEIFTVSIYSLTQSSLMMNTTTLTPGEYILFVANESTGNDTIPDTFQILAISSPFQLATSSSPQ
jgi:hypothetical protein